MTLEELRAKYGFKNGKYEPNPNCKFCRGSGERQTKAGLSFCICLYVDHEISDFAGDSLALVAKKMREELQGRK